MTSFLLNAIPFKPRWGILSDSVMAVTIAFWMPLIGSVLSCPLTIGRFTGGGGTGATGVGLDADLTGLAGVGGGVLISEKESKTQKNVQCRQNFTIPLKAISSKAMKAIILTYQV